MSRVSQTDYLDEVKLPKRLLDEIEEVAKEKGLSKEEKKKLEDEVKRLYLRSEVEPGEVMGIIAAQSISEPATQMSLPNSEKIILKIGENIKISKIGEFVDKTMEEFGFKKVGKHDVCDLPSERNVFVLSLNESEKVEWKKIKSCIRHECPETLIKLRTKSGRKIIATEFHSFITRKDNEIIPVAGKELKIGDRIPVLKHLPENCVEYLYVKEFNSSNTNQPAVDGMHLNNLFGFFVGAYLSEGSCSHNQIDISNVDNNFISVIKSFCSSTNLGWKDRRYIGEFGPSRTLSINSPFLSKFITYTCGKGSYNKKVPEFAFSAPEEFVASLLRGYFDGDGSVSVKRKMIRIYSNSEELIDGIKLLLTRFKIFAYKHKEKNQFYLLIPYKYAPIFLSKIGSGIEEKRKRLEKLSKLAENFWKKKSQDFNDMISGFGNILYITAKKLRYPTRYVNNFTKRQKIGRTTLYRYIKLFEKLAKKKNVDISKELRILKRMFNSDVVWDEITEISYVKPSSKYVYDISVDGLETFTTFDGIITHNTMRTYHFAGAAGIKVTYGLPRLIEIFDARREPKTPMMTIFLKKKFNNIKTAKMIAENIIERKISDLVKKVALNLSEGIIEIDFLDKRKLKPVISLLKENLKNVSVRKRGDKIIVSPKEEVEIRELQKLKRKILQLHASGIEGVENAVVRREGNNWIINTIGTNLEKVLLLKEVDEKKTISNDIYEIAKVFGIEAARSSIINEALKTMQEQGLDVDVRHVMLVADIMTFSGEIRPIGRYGVAGSKTSVLARAAFEETIKHLIRASIRGEEDRFQGIFENVMLGQVIPSGTGMFDLIAKLEKRKER